MGAISEGAKAGQSAGKKHGRNAGSKADPDGNRFKEGAKSATKGAVGGAAEGAAKGAFRGGVSGVKDGAKAGAKIGSAIPGFGTAVGGVIGGAVGGVGGTVLGGTSGLVSGATSGAKEGTKESQKPKKRRNTWQEIKAAIGGDRKAKYMLIAKGVLLSILISFLVIAIIKEEIAEATSGVAKSSTETIMASATSSESEDNSKGVELFATTGSLIMANDNELKGISDLFLNNLKSSNESYYNAFSTTFSGGTANTVAKKVKNITTNFETSETANLDIVNDNVTSVSGADNVSDSRTIFDHILRAEKYNFNNITWRAYEKSGNGLKKTSMSFQVDSNSKLKYPKNDVNETDNEEHNLDFFVSKVRPYLQSWYIPFDLIIGTQDAQDSNNLNVNFAYEILKSGYHEIVMDRYKLETLTRTTNYRVYDKTTTSSNVTRSCAKYKFTGTATRNKGEACTKDDFNQGLCEDSVTTFTKEAYITNCVKILGNKYRKVCNDEFATEYRNVSRVSCSDSEYVNNTYGCTYGKLKKSISISSEGTTKTLCIDSVTDSSTVEKDIRESIKTQDNKTYRFSYVVSMAKLFDRAILDTYDFEAYNNYSLDNYNSYINKKGNKSSITVEKFNEEEQNNSKADEYTHEAKDYYDSKEDVKSSNENWNIANLVSEIPKGATRTGSITKKVIKSTTVVTKSGKEYNDKYVFNDKLNYKDTKTGIYNVSSVEDAIGAKIADSDYSYYWSLYNLKDINIIDLLNSDKNLYSNYMSAYEISSLHPNIGIKKSALDVSYAMLKKDLTELSEKYPVSGLMYGGSIGVGSVGYSMLSSVNLANITESGELNETIVKYASQFVGYNLSDMMKIDDTGTFFRNHWCAMFVSYNLRKIEKETKIKIPIPSFARMYFILE